MIAVSALLHGLGRFSQPVFPLEEIRRRGDVSATLPLPCLGVLPLAQSVEDARQPGKGTVGLKGYPFAFCFCPASPVLFVERLEELVKGYRGLTGRDGFRLWFFRRAFNARARVKHTLCIYSFFLTFFDSVHWSTIG